MEMYPSGGSTVSGCRNREERTFSDKTEGRLFALKGRLFGRRTPETVQIRLFPEQICLAGMEIENRGKRENILPLEKITGIFGMIP